MASDLAAVADADLLRATLLVARSEYPELDVDAEARRVDVLADRGRHVVMGRGRERIDSFNAFFFEELGFRGNRQDYFDPRNSFVNEVVDRRTGIPISLAVVYLEVGRRLGFRTAGVAFPGHFLARCGGTIVDCFNQRVLDRDGCQTLLDAATEGALRLRDEMLEPAAPREIVGRMLANLRAIYLGRSDWSRALRTCELAVALEPGRPDARRDRGLALLHLEDFGRAVGDLEHYVRAARRADDVEMVGARLALARKLLARIN